ncbi:nuclear transport factor 2 family protein [Larkinella sp. VNQ87]|uniref:nuclear transport factor 2 family protein n=1 Tax=Larkinella sp. VNQ87 TaxID=3400921 RepID=UPI003C120B61
MSPSTQLVQQIYADIIQGNLSKVLPVLDENIRVEVPDSLPFGGIYHGREGYILMFSKRNWTWEALHIRPERYFTPENGSDKIELILVTGEMEAVSSASETVFTLPFVEQWQISEGKIITLKTFFWDTAQLLDTLSGQ